jgi:SAM-dependent methyltransferase
MKKINFKNYGILLNIYFALMLKPKGKQAFLSKRDSAISVLDVGCGNKSVIEFKALLPQCTYTGIDIADYNQSTESKNLIDNYIISTADTFANDIEKNIDCFDVIVSSHNLEHCNKPYDTLAAMISSLKPGGHIFISLPCIESLAFPSRDGTLNYFDDPTHIKDPPSTKKILHQLESSGLEVNFFVSNYQPFFLRLIGLVNEPFSRLRRKVLRGTWELFGFESIIHAHKPVNSPLNLINRN